LRQLEEYVLAVRGLLTEGRASFQGRDLKLTWWNNAHHVPIYLSAHGPKGLELAGRIGDGVIVGTGFTNEAIEFAQSRIETGARASGRELAEVEVWYLAYTALGDDDRTAADRFASILAVAGNLLARNPTVEKGVPAEMIPKFEELAARYDYAEHANSSATSHNAVLVKEIGLLDYLIDRFAVVGTSETCRRRLAEIGSRGVENLWCSRLPPGTQEFLRTWHAEVMPGFAE
jgi:5,10-methylenetetrahydromethanopterin reductase